MAIRVKDRRGECQGSWETKGASQPRASAEFMVDKTKGVFDIHRDYLSIRQAARSANHRINHPRRTLLPPQRKKQKSKRERKKIRIKTTQEGVEPRKEKDQNPKANEK